MNKRNPRRPFGSQSTGQTKTDEPKKQISADDRQSGLFGFFRDFGVRETIESFIVAIVLALMFRGFEAEAFIIPTGSMAPSLQGQHLDLECDHCRYRYRTGVGMAGTSFNSNASVESTYCPICQHETDLQPRQVPDHRTNNGDRILVNKFVYDTEDPQRYDVIVFKNPNNGKQNYIKRLVGLPGDNLLIENGDIYTMEQVPGEQDKWTRSITRKPPEKLLAVMQVVDDTHYIGPQLEKVNWPSRWSDWAADRPLEPQVTNGIPSFHLNGTDGEQIIRYRHLRPLKHEWEAVKRGVLPERMRPDTLTKGCLIGDSYSYNDRTYLIVDPNNPRRTVKNDDFSDGLHWVGDIGLEAEINIDSNQGTLLLDVVEGGAHFRCEIDVATGRAELSCDDPDVRFFDAAGKTPKTAPSAATGLRGSGSYAVRYVNADDRINLWIDDELVEFDAATFKRNEIPIPTWSPDDAGDAEPLGIGFVSGKLSVNRLKVLRDVYYTSVRGNQFSSWLGNETGLGSQDIGDLLKIYRTPELWSQPNNVAFFKKAKRNDSPMFTLLDYEDDARDEFLPCGDNSPHSLDGRVWDGPHHVDRQMLIGRAMFIYWPHTKNTPVRYFPNFESMKFIR